MRQELGWSAAIAVVVAAAIGINSHNSARPPADANSSTKLTRQSTTQPRKPPGLLAGGPCADIEERLQAFLINGDEDSIAAPPSCYGLSKRPDLDQALGGKIRKKTQTLRFVIATLPDPLHTNFPLSFDRLMEAVQQGATDENYIYDSSWLPWETDEDKFALIQDQDKADDRKKRREEQPGILLFRWNPRGKTAAESSCTNPGVASQPYDCGLVVFIVGEEPTQGIHRAQFQNAAAWIAALRPGPGSNPPLYGFPDTILGPSFSGSLPSLANALLDLKVKSEIKNKPDIQIYSGSITSKSLVEWFVAVTSLSFAPHLMSFQQSDNHAMQLYCRFLQRSGFHLNHLAVVSEDETAYGNDVQGDENEGCSKLGEYPARLFYPRDISTLRTAYQKQSIFNQPTESTTQDTSNRTLPSDIADPEGRQHDTIRNYSDGQTALSQEAVLQQIVSQLRAHQSEYVLLRSSNPLDELFLSHYLRLAYPQGRIVILGSDLLLRRESGAARLSGIMTLSTYPLLPWEEHWTRSKYGSTLHTHRVFPQDGAEGTYVATRYLLHLPSPLNLKPNSGESSFLPTSTDSRFSIPDYGPPAWTGQREFGMYQPPTWLSVLGRNDFWPVAALNDFNIPNVVPAKQGSHRKFLGDFFHELSDSTASLVRAWTPFRAKAYGDGKVEDWSPEFSMPVSMKIAFSILLAWVTFHLICCALPSIMAKPNHRAYFVCYPASFYQHRVLLVIGSWVLSSMATILALGVGMMSPVGEPVTHPALWLSYLPLIWSLACLALVVNAWIQPEALPPVSKERSKSESSTLYSVGGDTTGQASPASLVEIAGGRTKPDWQDRGLTRKTQNELRARFKIMLSHIASRFGSFAQNLKHRWPLLWPSLLFFVAAILFYFGLYFCSEGALTPATRIPTYWRCMNLTDGVSPLIPLMAPMVGMYLWFWYSLQGLAFFGPDHPKLPPEETLKLEVDGKSRDWLRMFGHKQVAEPIEKQCMPFAGQALLTRATLAALLGLFALFIAGDTPIRSLGASSYAILIFVLMDICVSVMLANAWRLLQVWMGLRGLLTVLYRLRLRRSMAALPGVSWGSVWKISGNVLDMRYRLLAREAECASHLQNSLDALESARNCALDSPRSFPDVDDALKELQDARIRFAEWYSESWDKSRVRDNRLLGDFQECLAKTAGVLFTKLLLPAWRRESAPDCDFSNPQSGSGDSAKECTELTAVANLDMHIRHAEQLVCYVYLGFIQNVLGRMRSLVMSIVWLYIGATISMASYPFDPRPAISVVMILLFLTSGAFVVFVYAQMHRDPILSLVTNTKPGELGMEFWLKLAGFGAGPLLGLLASIFPELTDIIFSWVQPSITSVR